MNKFDHNFLKNILPAVFVLLTITSCGSSSIKNENPFVKTDTTINENNAYSNLELDSAKLENYIAKNHVNKATAGKMRIFYKNRNYHFAWFSSDGLTEQARAFYNLHNTYIKAKIDTSIYDKELHNTMDKLIDDDSYKLTPEEITQTELHLTQHFFKFTKDVYEGTIDPSQLQWHIPRKKIDAVALLDSLMAKNGTKLEDWEPVNRFYPLLRDQLVKYYEIDKKGGWQKINLNNKAYKTGDSAIAVLQLKKRLKITGDYTGEDTSLVFTPQLEMALKHAQQRFGLNADGTLGVKTAKELNVNVKSRIEQILVNMERLKWMPNESSGTRLVANIPEFRLHVINGDQQEFSMKIVVGKAGHNTVIFTDSLEYIVFSPYWNVPQSIVRKEILPAMRRDRHYLQENNMEQTGTLNGLPVIRQKPGADNALGRVKFVFPNNYHIYFHDTPAKNLFDQNARAFSHGCIRLEQPQRLAEFLLKNDPEWPDSKIIDAMYSGKNTWVKLKHKVPVYIVYFTAWVTKDGTLNFRDDIYGHDAKMEKMMFKNQ
ncbi:MAG: L,D-transpeptidase family protein [Bacteroidota bacterium]|nr:L,D-transpeptidase family protein [Bacteroidota bacterium]